MAAGVFEFLVRLAFDSHLRDSFFDRTDEELQRLVESGELDRRAADIIGGGKLRTIRHGFIGGRYSVEFEIQGRGGPYSFKVEAMVPTWQPPPPPPPPTWLTEPRRRALEDEAEPPPERES
jgi:hypothetical protein